MGLGMFGCMCSKDKMTDGDLEITRTGKVWCVDFPKKPIPFHKVRNSRHYLAFDVFETYSFINNISHSCVSLTCWPLKHVFSLSGGSPLREPETITPKPEDLGTRKGRKVTCPPHGSRASHFSPRCPVQPEFLASCFQLPSQPSWRMWSVVLMTHSVVCSGTQLSFPEGKLQTNSSTSNSFSPCSAKSFLVFP